MIINTLNALIMLIALLPENVKALLLYGLYVLFWIVITVIITRYNRAHQRKHKDDFAFQYADKERTQ